jgi:hypothetical protein
MELDKEVGLEEGQRLVHKKYSASGFMANVDIDEYDIMDSTGRRIGGVRVTVHTDVKAPFRESRKVERF